MVNKNTFLTAKPILYLLLLQLTAFAASGCAAKAPIKITDSIKVENRLMQSEQINIEKPRDYFTIGERLVYEIRWLGAVVGEVVSTVKGIEDINGHAAYVVELTAKTNDFCSKIYRIDDKYVSYIDREKLITLKHIAKRSEGRYRKDAVTVFDQFNHKAYFENHTDNTKKVFDIPENVQDTLSAVYYFRTADIKIGDKIYYKVVNNEEPYDFFALVKNKVFVATEKGKNYETFYVEPYASLKGQRYKKGKASGYVSTDDLRIPVLGVIKAPLFTKLIVSLSRIDRAN